MEHLLMIILKPHRGTGELNPHSCECCHCPSAVPFHVTNLSNSVALNSNLLKTRIHSFGDTNE